MPGVTIKMNAPTVAALVQRGFNLYVFKAVQASRNAVPVVWIKTSQILQVMQVSWPDQYGAYVSTEQNSGIITTKMTPAGLGQTVSVDESGNLSVSGQGIAEAISISNQGTRPATAGICEMANGQLAPTMAIPLPGMTMEVIAPVEKVVLMLGEVLVDGGAVVVQTSAPGLFVDLTGGASERQVAFDINQGWSADGADWARPVPTNANLAPLLCQQGS
jgi:hypothetical protein